MLFVVRHLGPNHTHTCIHAVSRLLSWDGLRADNLGAMSLLIKGHSYAALWAMLFKTLGDAVAGHEVEEQGVCPHGTVCDAPMQEDVLLLQKQVKVEGDLGERQPWVDDYYYTTTTTTTTTTTPPSTVLPAEWRGFASAFFHQGAGRDPMWAVDKNPDTWFGCSDCEWAADLGSIQEISEVEISWGGCECIAAQSLRIDTSSDRIHWQFFTWIDGFRQWGGTPTPRTFAGSAVMGRYVRVSIRDPNAYIADNNWFSFWEVRAKTGLIVAGCPAVEQVNTGIWQPPGIPSRTECSCLSSEEFQKPQPLLVSKKVRQYGSTPPICIAGPPGF